MSGALLIAGLGLIALAAWASRRGGARARAARLLAGLSPITPHQALLAGEGRYLAIEGGIDAAEAFDDENHRPLVYRRERVLVADKTTWRELERVVRSVPFFIADGGHAVAIDAAALAGGLVVIERQWEGSVAELAAAAREYRDPATTALVKQLAVSTPTLTARVILEQISTLDRGTAAGLLRNGTLTAGGEGQPLVLTTLDRRDALRILGNERSGNLAASLLTLAALVAGIAITVIAAAGLIGLLLGLLPGLFPSLGLTGFAVAVVVALVIEPLGDRAEVQLLRALERRADRFVIRLVGAAPIAGALNRLHRRECAQIALSLSIEYASAIIEISARRIELASAALIDVTTTTGHLFSIERMLTADLPARARAEIRRVRREDHWGQGQNEIYGTLEERIGRIRS